MGFLSDVGDFFSSVVSTASTVLKSAVAPIAKALAPILAKIPGVIGVIARVAQVVFTALDIFKSDESVEEIGDRTIQAEEAGISSDKFENHDAYMEALRDFELDPKRSEEISTEEKFIVGMATGSLGMVEKHDVKIDGLSQVWLLVAKNPEYFNSDRITAIVEKGADMKKVADYFQDKLGPTESVNVEKILLDIDRKMDPDLSDRDLYSQFDQVKGQVRDGI